MPCSRWQQHYARRFASKVFTYWEKQSVYSYRRVLSVRRNLHAQLNANMTRMYNPPHPGEVLREYLGDVTVTDAAANLGVSRATLSRVVTGSSGISPDLAYRLGDAFGTSAEIWAGMQMQYDLYQAGKVKRPRIQRMAA